MWPPALDRHRQARRRLRSTLTSEFVGGAPQPGVVRPPSDSVSSGVRFQMIYEAAHAADPWGAHSVEQSVQAGEDARMRGTVPVKMVHVDDRIALVTVDRSGASGAVLVREGALLALLADWFDRLWDDPATVALTGSAVSASSLTSVQRRVLHLMAAGLTDETIATRLGTSVRTVRRHVGALQDELAAESRFAAGVAAAKRGWL